MVRRAEVIYVEVTYSICGQICCATLVTRFVEIDVSMDLNVLLFLLGWLENLTGTVSEPALGRGRQSAYLERTE